MSVQTSLKWLFAITFLILLIPTAGCSSQQTFASSDQAVDTLIGAIRAHDKDQIRKILGPESDDLISSGDPVADQNQMAAFLAAYDEKHTYETTPEGKVILVVGNSGWPMPIPLMKGPFDQWVFDMDTGKEEMINRRVGRNQLDTIETCLAIVDAQRDYATMDPEKAGTKVYAQKFLSDEGKKNGLYWEAKTGEPDSPLGDAIVAATKEGYKFTAGKPNPYHGYYFRILKAQGPNAPGGTLDYLTDGKLTKGFAVLAYPADYNNSGVETFIVNETGIVFSRDLGPDTAKIAQDMTAYDPGPEWNLVKDSGAVIGK